MTKLIDITAFNAVKESEVATPIAMKTTDGQDTGISFLVIGRYSEPVQKWSKRIFAEYQREADIAKRKGKEPASKSIDELREQNIDGAMVRVIGWQGVKQEFSKEILKQALEANPHWVDAIVEESDNAANFTKAL
jgi:hypothetical protein